MQAYQNPWASPRINQQTSEGKRCYTVEDVMSILDVGRKAVYGLIHQKAFPAIKIPSVGYRIPKESFNAWMCGK